MKITPYQIFAYFLIYSILGWCVEVAYAALHSGKIVNRGFLNGPVCPIYGFGMLAALGALTPADSSTLALFFGGMVLTSLIELIGGYVLYHAYHMRWWDYSHLPFNIGGYVCLEFSIYWGIGVVLVMRCVHPPIAELVKLIPGPVGWVVMAVLYAVYFVDLIVTLNTVAGLNRDLKQLSTITDDLKAVSNRMTDVIGNRALDTGKNIGEAQVQMALARAEFKEAGDGLKEEMRTAGEEMKLRGEEEIARNLAELQRKHEMLLQKSEELQAKVHAPGFASRTFGARRLMKAFPQLSSELNQDALEVLREWMKK